MTAQHQPNNLHRLVSELWTLMDLPASSFGSLTERDVPRSSGTYIVYEGADPLYAGSSGRGQRGLQWRLIGNHKRGVGQDTFRRKLGTRTGLSGRQLSAYIRTHCCVRWRQLSLRDAELLEHFAIAVLNPPLNG